MIYMLGVIYFIVGVILLSLIELRKTGFIEVNDILPILFFGGIFWPLLVPVVIIYKLLEKYGNKPIIDIRGRK